MKRIALLLIGLGLVSSAVGCCGTGCGRPMMGMASGYDQAMYTPTMTAAAPSCSCGY